MERQGTYLHLTTGYAVLWIIIWHSLVYANDIVGRGSPDERTPTEKWAVHLDSGQNPDSAAKEMGAENLGQIAGLDGMYLFRFPESRIRGTADAVQKKLKENAKIKLTSVAGN